MVETTGLADPVPVAQTFFMDDDVRSKTRLDAVGRWWTPSTCRCASGLEGSRGPDRLRRRRHTQQDHLVTPEELRDVEATVRAINPAARIHRTQRSGVPLGEVLDRGAFDLSRALENDPHFLDADEMTTIMSAGRTATTTSPPYIITTRS